MIPTDPLHDGAARGIDPTRASKAQDAPVARPSGDGAAFRALLERLEAQTRDLAREADQVSDAASLAGAVDRARASVQDALALGEDLLEAYHAARQRAETGDDPQPE